MADIRDQRFWTSLVRKVLRILFKSAGYKAGPNSHHQHVVPHEEGWAVKGEGNEKYTYITNLQSDAIERAREIAINYRADVIIHRADGSIRDRMSYRN